MAALGEEDLLAQLLQQGQPHLFRKQSDLLRHGGLGDMQLCELLPRIDGILLLLLGLGYSAFSVESTLIPSLAASVHRTDAFAAAALAATVCAAPDGDAVRLPVGLGSEPRRCIAG